ncbi:unnamed protein product [Linum tenue]|uniref:Sulfite exporter TauE/SafE family protein n=1 Tax=Linum tenue TaxID=586396 RepID=A0AAV0KLK1_9ROSI|nr:unnamed protein product [Linum tenue]
MALFHKPTVQVAALGGFILAAASVLVLADSSCSNGTDKVEDFHHLRRSLGFISGKGRVGYQHVWPGMEFGWRIVVGTVIGFIGAACGSVGGVGGGGIFVPMLTLIIGFDPKSSTAISKCMITGAAAATVYYNLKMRHPTLELPVIDYDLALMFQPMLMLGISIGVALNVLFADWMITILLIFFFLVTSTKSFLKGVETWKKETKSKKVTILENVYWKKLGLLVAVWLIILVLQIGKNYTSNCSLAYWLLNFCQIPVAVAVSSYEAIGLYKGRRKIASRGEVSSNLRVHQLLLYCFLGLLAGIVGGMLGLGGGFILGPLFLELGVPPQVASATSTFAMTFSASMSVVEYYLLKRFPVPYALYFFGVATISALAGQHVIRKLIALLGRASLIIFTLSFTIFVSAILLGGIGIVHMIKKIEGKEYMGFEDICS